MESLEGLEAQRVARELELLEERRALAMEEEDRRRGQEPLLLAAAAARRGRLEAAGVPAPPEGSPSTTDWLELLDRMAPLLEALGPSSGPLAKMGPLMRQLRGVQAMMNARKGTGSGRSREEVEALLRQAGAGDPMAMARGQKIDRQTAAFLRSLGVEAKEGEAMSDALRRIATGLNSGQKAEVKEKASKLLEGLVEPSDGPA